MVCTTGLTHCFLPATAVTVPEVAVVSGIPVPLTITNHLMLVVGGSLDHGRLKIAWLANVTNSTKVTSMLRHGTDQADRGYGGYSGILSTLKHQPSLASIKLK